MSIGWRNKYFLSENIIFLCFVFTLRDSDGFNWFANTEYQYGKKIERSFVGWFKIVPIRSPQRMIGMVKKKREINKFKMQYGSQNDSGILSDDKTVIGEIVAMGFSDNCKRWRVYDPETLARRSRPVNQRIFPSFYPPNREYSDVLNAFYVLL